MSTPPTQPALFFKALPAGLTELTEKLFPKQWPIAVILSLTAVDQMNAHERNTWLHKTEEQQFTAYTHAKRSREWLGGRICAKEGLQTVLNRKKQMSASPTPVQCRVASEKSGRPYFAAIPGNSIFLPELSITHSNALAAALISPGQCGIDIQYSSKKLQRVQERFCTPDEEILLRKFLPHHSFIFQLTLLWSGKEAVKKMLSTDGIPGFHELKLRQITPQANNNATLDFSLDARPGTLFSVAAGKLDKDYALALCCRNTISSSVTSSPHA